MTLLKKHLPESFLSQTWLSTVPPWNGRKPLLWYSNDTFTILDERTFLNVNKLWIFSSFVAIFYKFYILSPGQMCIRDSGGNHRTRWKRWIGLFQRSLWGWLVRYRKRGGGYHWKGQYWIYGGPGPRRTDQYHSVPLQNTRVGRRFLGHHWMYPNIYRLSAFLPFLEKTPSIR